MKVDTFSIFKLADWTLKPQLYQQWNELEHEDQLSQDKGFRDLVIKHWCSHWAKLGEDHDGHPQEEEKKVRQTHPLSGERRVRDTMPAWSLASVSAPLQDRLGMLWLKARDRLQRRISVKARTSLPLLSPAKQTVDYLTIK